MKKLITKWLNYEAKFDHLQSKLNKALQQQDMMSGEIRSLTKKLQKWK